MPEHLSILHPGGTIALAAAVAAWLVLVRPRRRNRGGGQAGRARQTMRGARPSDLTTPHSLPALPAQRGLGPHRESVDLTPAERAAFAGLVRRLGSGH